MLIELVVRNLGVIADLRLLVGEGMTALTGETGAGKTMLVEALELLVGGKADAALVRPGCDEAVIEGRFVLDDDEVVLARVVPAVGRSRAYVNGRIAPAPALAERGASLVDLHGQHEHQSLLSPAVQRHALDRFGGVDLTALVDAKRDLAEVESQLAELGGDERSRARELDLVRFQVSELEAAQLTDPDEDERLAAEEDELADARAHQNAAGAAVEALTGDGGAGAARRRAAAPMAEAIERHLVELAMVNATVGVSVGGTDPGDEVAFLLAANKGAPELPLAKVASGGELARAMLALRLVLLSTRDDTGPPTLVFDEVDAGIGGQAANAVGRALAALATQRQVLVVTHLPQVAACATTPIAVTKRDDGTTTTATAAALADSDRVIELSRMLSGSPDSATAQQHAAELLAAARSTKHPPET